MQVWTADRVGRVLAAVANDMEAAICRVALLCGLRRGERLALWWDDVDLARGVLAVRRTRTPTIGGGWAETIPKTANSRRAVAFAAVLRAIAATRPDDAEPHVFRLPDGGPYSVDALVSAFERATTAAGVPTIRFHAMRHTAATLMLEAGVHPKVVAERLGHKGIEITLNRYSHVVPGLPEAAAVDALVSNGACPG